MSSIVVKIRSIRLSSWRVMIITGIRLGRIVLQRLLLLIIPSRGTCGRGLSHCGRVETSPGGWGCGSWRLIALLVGGGRGLGTVVVDWLLSRAALWLLYVVLLLLRLLVAVLLGLGWLAAPPPIRRVVYAGLSVRSGGLRLNCGGSRGLVGVSVRGLHWLLDYGATSSLSHRFTIWPVKSRKSALTSLSRANDHHYEQQARANAQAADPPNVGGMVAALITVKTVAVGTVHFLPIK